MKLFILLSACWIGQALSSCHLPPGDFNCLTAPAGTYPDPRDCGRSFVQCPNPQGGKTGAAISCGPTSWFNPNFCNCHPGQPDCSKLRDDSSGGSSGGGSGGSRPVSSGGGFGGSRPGPSRDCDYVDCRRWNPRDSTTVFPVQGRPTYFRQCSHGRPVDQRCNGGQKFNWNICSC